ncbi:MAG: hypothetical protein KME15_02555 [Drouetiella hepatica Uher 2000/2452]|jgi:hypothetical protein|uniref:Uncharacterized protein n=1 Tax=Drouetiella hepatica Uher 2000/2452 TaxID=904376 RepID=A0A951UKR7_9CYAN|nr:hypothetical protein [Drouetiella hepatica Uher 2000/2452]
MLTQKLQFNLLSIGKLIYSFYTLAHLTLLAWGTYHFAQFPSPSLAILLLVLGGLVYDNLIIFIGGSIGMGDRLLFLHKIRYWLHGLLSPLLLVFAVQVLHTAHVRWDSPWSDRLSVALAFTLIVIEVCDRMIKLNLKPITFAGTLRYKEVVPSKEIPVILVILCVGAIGAVVWQQLGWSWMFWGALLMMLGSAVPTTTKAGPSVGSGVEVLLGLSLLATQIALLK